jgi:hypothetical protein
MQYVIRGEIGLQSLSTVLIFAERNFTANALPVTRSMIRINPLIALRIQTSIADWGGAHC